MSQQNPIDLTMDDVKDEDLVVYYGALHLPRRTAFSKALDALHNQALLLDVWSLQGLSPNEEMEENLYDVEANLNIVINKK